MTKQRLFGICGSIFLASALACGACGDDSASGDPQCGNGELEEGEVCDGNDLGGRTCEDQGFDDGDLSCSAACDAFDTSRCNMDGTCGDSVVEGAEVCDGSELRGRTCIDEGFAGGALVCNSLCSAYDTSGCWDTPCGNGQIDAPELCDGTNVGAHTCADEGFTGGVLDCNASCDAYDTSACTLCGDDMAEGAEACDGLDLAGQTCVSLGFASGTVQCDASCTGFDTSGCVPHTCGNNTIDTGEICDGALLNGHDCTDMGFWGGTLTCGVDCLSWDVTGCTNPSAPTAFRTTALYLRDPHIIAGAAGTCMDVTDNSILGLTVNGALNDNITALELNILQLFRPLDQSAAGGGLDVLMGTCTTATSCGPSTGTPLTTFHTNYTTGVCGEPITGTTNSIYSGSINTPTDNCYNSGRISMALPVIIDPTTTLNLQLQDVQVAAIYNQNPATGLITGLLAGFMTETYASTTTVDLPVLGTVTISSLIPGGTGYNCPAPFNYDDRDVALDGTTTGWWFYMNFTAVQVAYSGP